MKNFEPPKILGKFYTNSSFIIYITVPQSLQRSEERFSATGCVSKDSAKGLHKTANLCRRLKCLKREFFSTHLLRDEWIFCNFALALRRRAGTRHNSNEFGSALVGTVFALAFEMQQNTIRKTRFKHVLLRGGQQQLPGMSGGCVGTCRPLLCP